MFGVNDLLISHGYKQSKNPTSSSKDPDDGDQREDTDRQSSQASRNGLPIHPGAIPKTNQARRYQPNDKSNLVTRGRNAHHEDFSGPCNVQGGPYDQTKLSRSSHSKKERDLPYRRRQCQDFGAHNYPDRVDSETKRMDAAGVFFEGRNERQWEAEEKYENMRSNKQETMKLPGDYIRQKQPTAFRQCKPDIDNKERLHQDVYLERRNILACHFKHAPLYFPKYFSPDTSNPAEIPAIASCKQHKVKPELESLKHTEPATGLKYGRPLKPPSYELYQQSRGIVETNPPEEEQQKHRTTFYVTKVDESGQDPTLEPPGYISPPSYKSSGQQSKNQHVPKEVSNCFVKEIQVLEQNICISSESSVNQLQMEEGEQIMYSNKTQVKSLERHLPSVQYIPFDDPRIRHIKVVHPADHQMADKAEDNNNSIFYKNPVDQEFNNAHVDSINIAVKCSQVPGSRRGLVEPKEDQDSCVFSIQRGSYGPGNNMNYEYPEARPSSQSPGATEASSEILTKVKTFEPGTEIQSKNHLKKKTNETMFYLVSAPLQTELNTPCCSSEKDGSGSNRDLTDQSFLSTSSSDLELQALTGNIINHSILEKQQFQRPEFKQMNGLNCKQLPKHKELKYSGSWPCTKYKDQETQTSFSEEPKIQQPPHGLQLGKTNTLTNDHVLKYRSSTESATSNLPTDNRKDRPIPPPRKAHINKLSKPECPRTVVNPKTGQNESCISSTGLPRRKNEPSFAHKEERKSSCSTKETFGQFLLKPVSRRPWDAISELENFNKKIQKQEESSSEDIKENEQKQEREEEEKKVKKAEEKACRADEVSQDYGCATQMRTVKPVTSVFKKETDKSKPKSENASNISFRNVRSEARAMDRSIKEKKKNVDLKQKQENARKIIKQAIDLHPMKSNVSGHSDRENSSIPFNSTNSKKASIENHENKDSDKLKRAAGRNIPAKETAPIAPVFIKRKNQGCSEPNLRSVGLDVNEGTSIPHSSAKNIPPNESLQARASRILGIDVAMESLTTNKALPAEDSDSDNMAQSSVKEKVLMTEMKMDMASSKGKLKSGWSKSTFIGDDILEPAKNQPSGKGKLIRQSYVQQRLHLNRRKGNHASSHESAMLPLAERKPLPSNVEKKTRSTSKVTVPKPGNVASAVSRAAMDRLARMKEVDSVSRMRRLSIKNSGSGDDKDEDKKQVRKSQGKGNDSVAGHTEFPRKLSQGSCVSKRIISLSENARLGNTNTKKSGRDLPSSGVCDPRV